MFKSRAKKEIKKKSLALKPNKTQSIVDLHLTDRPDGNWWLQKIQKVKVVLTYPSFISMCRHRHHHRRSRHMRLIITILSKNFHKYEKCDCRSHHCHFILPRQFQLHSNELNGASMHAVHLNETNAMKSGGWFSLSIMLKSIRMAIAQWKEREKKVTNLIKQ